MVIAQIEYYFSIDNLSKDLYLRKLMDSEGWVPLCVIASFRRMILLTNKQYPNEPLETLNNIVFTISNNAIEKQLRPDGWYIRKANGWEQWVLSEGERHSQEHMEKLKADTASGLAQASFMRRQRGQMTPGQIEKRPSMDQKRILPQSNNLEIPPHFPSTYHSMSMAELHYQAQFQQYPLHDQLLQQYLYLQRQEEELRDRQRRQQNQSHNPYDQGPPSEDGLANVPKSNHQQYPSDLAQLNSYYSYYGSDANAATHPSQVPSLPYGYEMAQAAGYADPQNASVHINAFPSSNSNYSHLAPPKPQGKGDKTRKKTRNTRQERLNELKQFSASFKLKFPAPKDVLELTSKDLDEIQRQDPRKNVAGGAEMREAIEQWEKDSREGVKMWGRKRQTLKTLESRVEATQSPKAEEGSAHVSTTGKNSADEEEIDFDSIEAELAALEAEEARREEEYTKKKATEREAPLKWEQEDAEAHEAHMKELKVNKVQLAKWGKGTRKQ